VAAGRLAVVSGISGFLYIGLWSIHKEHVVAV